MAPALVTRAIGQWSLALAFDHPIGPNPVTNGSFEDLAVATSSHAFVLSLSDKTRYSGKQVEHQDNVPVVGMITIPVEAVMGTNVAASVGYIDRALDSYSVIWEWGDGAAL